MNLNNPISNGLYGKLFLELEENLAMELTDPLDTKLQSRIWQFLNKGLYDQTIPVADQLDITLRHEFRKTD